MPTSLPLHYKRGESINRRPPGEDDRSKTSTMPKTAAPRLQTSESTTTGNQGHPTHITLPPQESPTANRRITYAQPSASTSSLPVGYTPIIEATKNVFTGSIPHPDAQAQSKDGSDGHDVSVPLTTDELSRAVVVAAVSALRHGVVPGSPTARRGAGGLMDSQLMGSGGGGHGGHDAPSWSRTVSASVLLGCTLLYAIIAGELVVLTKALLNFGLQKFS